MLHPTGTATSFSSCFLDSKKLLIPAKVKLYVPAPPCNGVFWQRSWTQNTIPRCTHLLPTHLSCFSAGWTILHAAGTKLSPLPNQLIWPGYHGSGLQSKSQTNPEGLAAGEQKKLNWESCSSCQINVGNGSWGMEVEGAPQFKRNAHHCLLKWGPWKGWP